MIHFTCYTTPQPQGSSKGFVIKGRAVITSANKKLRPFRGDVTREAMYALAQSGAAAPLAAKHVPVTLCIDFYFARPQSVPKRRSGMVVRPDLDKCVRSTTDALTGLLYHDDAQVTEYRVRKFYGSPERVEISMEVTA